MWKWIIYINIVHIECMLRKFHSTFMQKFGTVNDRMHQRYLPFVHMHAVPSENLIYRQAMTVLHNFLAGCPLLLINKIADQHIHGLRSTHEFSQCMKNLCISFFIYPVIAVYNLKNRDPGHCGYRCLRRRRGQGLADGWRGQCLEYFSWYSSAISAVLSLDPSSITRISTSSPPGKRDLMQFSI